MARAHVQQWQHLPGRTQALPDYPFRLYFDKLKLWHRVYDGPDECVGPLVAGRLHGRAHRIALQLRVPRPDGTFDQGDSALVRLAVDEVRDPINPNQILQAHIPSGVQCLCNALRDAFGQSDQDMASSSLDRFFECRRHKMSFQEYAVEWDMRLEEAADRAGLQINEVAKFYLFFKSSGLPPKMIDDLKMQIGGNLNRFADARSLALCLSNKSDAQSDVFYNEDYYQEPTYTDEDWYSQEWYDPMEWIGEDYYQENEDVYYDYEDDGDYEDYDEYYDHPRWTLRRYHRRRNQVENNRPMLQKTRRKFTRSTTGSRRAKAVAATFVVADIIPPLSAP